MKFNSVTDIVTEYLREQIITGQLSSGERLNEVEIAKLMEISRPPLREAFRKLEHEKLVVNIPRKGTFVSHISILDYKQLFHVRKLLELSALDCLEINGIRQLPTVEETLLLVEKLPTSFPSPPEAQQMLDYYKAMAAFHEELVKSCENPWLIHSYNSLGGSLARYQILYLNFPGSRQASMDDHLYILDRIKEGDFEGAKRSLSDHINSTAKHLEENMTQAEMQNQE